MTDKNYNTVDDLADDVISEVTSLDYLRSIYNHYLEYLFEEYRISDENCCGQLDDAVLAEIDYNFESCFLEKYFFKSDQDFEKFKILTLQKIREVV